MYGCVCGGVLGCSLWLYNLKRAIKSAFELHESTQCSQHIGGVETLYPVKLCINFLDSIFCFFFSAFVCFEKVSSRLCFCIGYFYMFTIARPQSRFFKALSKGKYQKLSVPKKRFVSFGI